MDQRNNAADQQNVSNPIKRKNKKILSQQAGGSIGTESSRVAPAGGRTAPPSARQVFSIDLSKVVHRLFHAQKGVGKAVVNRQASACGLVCGESRRQKPQKE